MALDLQNIGVYRIMAIERLEDVLANGTYSKRNYPEGKEYYTIGNKEIIGERDRREVKCYPGTVVNDYVPFYFSVRTPMLYNIKTGMGVPKKAQEDIIYCCYRLADLATDQFQWCYTDGNAAKIITKYYTDLDTLETNIDWRSINTTDFRDNNADGDEDRIRKKHAEFLVKNHVPAQLLKAIVVFNTNAKAKVTEMIEERGAALKILINPNNKFYF